jgi:hypothetical protein
MNGPISGAHLLPYRDEESRDDSGPDLMQAACGNIQDDTAGRCIETFTRLMSTAARWAEHTRLTLSSDTAGRCAPLA